MARAREPPARLSSLTLGELWGMAGGVKEPQQHTHRPRLPEGSGMHSVRALRFIKKVFDNERAWRAIECRLTRR